MLLGRPNLGSLLVRQGCLQPEGLELALSHQAEHGGRIGEILVELSLCSETDVARTLAEQIGLLFVDLRLTPPIPSVVALVPREIAVEYGLLPVRMVQDRLVVAVRDPFDIRAEEIARRVTGAPVMLACAPRSQLQDLIQRYAMSYDDAPPTPPASAALQGTRAVEVEPGTVEVPVDRLMAAGDQASALQVVDSLLGDAIRRGASDLHIEAQERHVNVRYRLDGRMRTVASFPRSLLASTIARIKVMAEMDISESRRPQDGGMSFCVDGKLTELRISLLPGIFGESAVIRILNRDQSLRELESLGFDAATLREYRELLAERHGMLLATGPAGSGKTTTLYASLSHLNTDRINIIAVEDPVEVKLPGITQVQVQDRAGCTFSTLLRAILRHDPDIVCVGEIRDLETAEIACRAALTGHLVLSSLHTRDSLGALTRLSDMGIPRYVVSAALNGVVAQRLVRRNCELCVADYDPPSGVRQALEATFGPLQGRRFRSGKGCLECHYIGTRGRIGLYELLVVDDTLRHLLVDGCTVNVLREAALSRGLRTLLDDAFDKACDGLIPPEEVVALGLGLARRSRLTPPTVDALCGDGAASEARGSTGAPRHRS